MIENNDMIIAQDCYYSLNCLKTQRNNNVLVVGTPGSGKTRSIVTPNILQAYGSYVVSDPKGRLYDEYKSYLKERGYRVIKLDFTEPEESCHYNFFEYIHGSNDIMKISHMIMNSKADERKSPDPFWGQASEILLSSLIAYLMDSRPKAEQNIKHVMKLLEVEKIYEFSDTAESVLDRVMEEYRKRKGMTFGYRQFVKFKQAAKRTMQSILISISAQLGQIDTPELNIMTADDEIDIPTIGEQKTAVFVVVSDTDRSKDAIANLFYTQAFNELCLCADKRYNGRLPVDVRFILDDFATNCYIDEFPRLISSFRSRGISAMLMLQAESQLRAMYDDDCKTIIGSCDTYVYLGGGDIETASQVAIRADIPLQEVLWMPVGENWIFRRGELPIHGKNFELEPFREKKLSKYISQLEK